ncbi:TIGR03000 domain-containing protein [Thermopirellula anaerolimosa]
MPRKTLLFSVLTGAVVSLASVSDAQGYWHWRVWDPCCPTYVSAWTCCDPCWTPCDPCCGPVVGAWYVGIRPGPIRRLILGPYRWYRAPYVGCCDICGCDVCDCEPSWGTAPSGPQMPTPAPAQNPPAQPSPQPAPPSAPGAPMTIPEPPMSSPVNPTSYEVPTRNDSGLLTIYVPADATVTINGLPTKSLGTRREYVSYGLQNGLQYRYTVTAVVERDGKAYEETREVILTAGDKKGVAFSFQLPTENVAGI